jgi:hypothetical protein
MTIQQALHVLHIKQEITDGNLEGSTHLNAVGLLELKMPSLSWLLSAEPLPVVA